MACLGIGFQGIAFGVLMPIAFGQGDFGGFFTVFGLRVDGVLGGLEVAGVFLPTAVVLALLTPLGIVSIATIVVAWRRQRVLPMAAAAAVWFLLALATVILSGSAWSFLATEMMLLVLALVAAWPEVQAFTRRR